MLKIGLTSSLSSGCKTYTLLTSVHNDTDNADDADDYDRVIGVELLKAFSCASKVRGPFVHVGGPYDTYSI